MGYSEILRRVVEVFEEYAVFEVTSDTELEDLRLDTECLSEIENRIREIFGIDSLEELTAYWTIEEVVQAILDGSQEDICAKNWY